MNNIRSKISEVSKGKQIPAKVVEIINGYVTVSTNGRLYKGLNVVGGPVVVDQKVILDFGSGTPVVHAYSSSSSISKTVSRQVVTRVIADEELEDPETGKAQGDHTHTESQITDLNHDAKRFQGNPVSSYPPSEGDTWKFIDGMWTPMAIPSGGSSGGSTDILQTQIFS